MPSMHMMNQMMPAQMGGYQVPFQQEGHMQHQPAMYGAQYTRQGHMAPQGMMAHGMPPMQQQHSGMQVPRGNYRSAPQQQQQAVPQQAPKQQPMPQQALQGPLAHPPQPSPPPMSDPPAPTHPEEGILVPECQPGGTPSVHRPCLHNDWDDVRTRKGSKILRCRLCQRKWKLASSTVPRCASFLQNICPNGLQCAFLHVHKKKSHAAEGMPIECAPACGTLPVGTTPEPTPPASPSALLHSLRNLQQKPTPASPVHRDTRDLLNALRQNGWGQGLGSAPPSPSPQMEMSRRHSSRYGMSRNDSNPSGMLRHDSHANGSLPRNDSHVHSLLRNMSMASAAGMVGRKDSMRQREDEIGKEILAGCPPSPSGTCESAADEAFLQSLQGDNARGIAARRGRPNLGVAVQGSPNGLGPRVMSKGQLSPTPRVAPAAMPFHSPTAGPMPRGGVVQGKLEFHQIADYLNTPHSQASPHFVPQQPQQGAPNGYSSMQHTPQQHMQMVPPQQQQMPQPQGPPPQHPQVQHAPYPQEYSTPNHHPNNGSLSGSDQSPNDNYIPSPGSSMSSPNAAAPGPREY
eukprot:TRINITY_DN6558_c5_g1_i1.p2 TRINITY_DN6558_c5_g1~~TRINITY_DN6558_c5_g1_i1.p2  ORF type:complete len:572 (+),score=227.54 TRINITY_DN6558_c5_g1_i1:68-1783(+)